MNRGILKIIALYTFAFGMALCAKHYDFAYWMEANTWVALPMIIVGGVSIVLLFGGKD